MVTQTKPAEQKWLLQAGAFSKQKAAVARASELAGACTRSKLAAPIVEPMHTSDGRTLWRVVLGTFDTKESAESMRRTLGRSSVLVVKSSDAR
ncbi:MAG: SPOR domain-containing protein [Planctomycetota bacterium]|nr:SPOR domain-containing protein [Planctomycetota bacterium]